MHFPFNILTYTMNRLIIWVFNILIFTSCNYNSHHINEFNWVEGTWTSTYNGNHLTEEWVVNKDECLGKSYFSNANGNRI